MPREGKEVLGSSSVQQMVAGALVPEDSYLNCCTHSLHHEARVQMEFTHVLGCPFNQL